MSQQQADREGMSAEERMERKKDIQMDVSAEKRSQQIAAEEVSEIHRNPEFMEKLQELGVQSETFEWIEEELGVELAGAHVFGNRDDGYAERVDLMSSNTTAKLVAEASPGRILREHPDMLAIARGLHHRVDGTVEDVLNELQPPANAQEKRVMRSADELITNHKAKAEDSTGLDAVSTVQTERKNHSNEESETTSEERALKGFLG